MDLIFDRGEHSREEIEQALLMMFNRRGFLPIDIPVIRIMEGYDLDTRVRVFPYISELADQISDCFRDTDVFKRAIVLIDDCDVLFLMFTSSKDAQMPAIMDMAVVGNA